MRSTFKLLFYINRQKLKKNGKCPIMGRVTLDGKVCQYSTGLEVNLHIGTPTRAELPLTDVGSIPPAKRERNWSG